DWSSDVCSSDLTYAVLHKCAHKVRLLAYTPLIRKGFFIMTDFDAVVYNPFVHRFNFGSVKCRNHRHLLNYEFLPVVVDFLALFNIERFLGVTSFHQLRALFSLIARIVEWYIRTVQAVWIHIRS